MRFALLDHTGRVIVNQPGELLDTIVQKVDQKLGDGILVGRQKKRLVAALRSAFEETEQEFKDLSRYVP